MGEDSGFVFGYQNLRTLLEGGPDNSDGSGEVSSAGCRLGACLGIKSARSSSNVASGWSGVWWYSMLDRWGLRSFHFCNITTTPICQFLAANESGVWPDLFHSVFPTG